MDSESEDQGAKGREPNTVYSNPFAIADKFLLVHELLEKYDATSTRMTLAVRNLENSLEFSQQEILTLKKENTDLKIKLGAIVTEDRRTQFQVKAVEDKVDRLETTTKKKKLILEGLPDLDGRREDVAKTVCAVFEQLKVGRGINCEACYRMGPFKENKT